MNKKKNGSFIIWVICLFLLISVIITFRLSNIYEDNKSLILNKRKFAAEQEIYSYALYYIAEHKNNIQNSIYYNKVESLPYSGFKPKDILSDGIYIQYITINDDKFNLDIRKETDDSKYSGYFNINSLPSVFEVKEKIIDNTIDQKYKNYVEDVINKIFSQTELKYKDDVDSIIKIDGGDYIFVFDDDLKIFKDETLVEEIENYDKIAIISSNQISNIKFITTGKINFSRLFIINNGDIYLDDISFNGCIFIKNGNIYANNISGEGRIMIDGNSYGMDGIGKVNDNNFKIKNKYLAMFDSIINLRIKNFKR